jgi:hypothetical protein
LFLEFIPTIINIWRRGGSVSIVSECGQAIEVRSPAKAKRIFSSGLLCPDWLWGPPSLMYNGYRGSFAGGKPQSGHGAYHSPPSIAEIVNE